MSENYIVAVGNPLSEPLTYVWDRNYGILLTIIEEQGLTLFDPSNEETLMLVNTEGIFILHSRNLNRVKTSQTVNSNDL